MSPMVGIESIRCYPTTLALEMPDLCEARKVDERYVRSDLLVEARGVNPPWQDTVTTGCRHGKRLEREKPISSWVHCYLVS